MTEKRKTFGDLEVGDLWLSIGSEKSFFIVIRKSKKKVEVLFSKELCKFSRLHFFKTTKINITNFSPSDG